MKSTYRIIAAGLSLVLGAGAAQAGVTAEAAATLKTTLTPFGAERAGNKDGSIPAWTGAATAGGDFNSSRRRGDPFASEKPVLSINARNMDQYSDRLTEGTKALMKKFPQSFRIDVYPTHRTAIAPQWAYDATAKNATAVSLVDSPSGAIPVGVYGPIPFPIPKTGVEVVWNHLMRWRAPNAQINARDYQLTADGQWLLLNDAQVDSTYPFLKQGKAAEFNGEYLLVRQRTLGPAIRAGEAVAARYGIDDEKTKSWVYLTGQRRVRKLPNPCCDTPSAFAAGSISFDEVNVFGGRTNRFDWKLIGKKEVYIPYNSNRTMQPAKESDLFGAHHLNPDHVRWELHRVWVVEASVRNGQRHTSPKSRYYFDEDTWLGVIAERYDASGALARVPFNLPMVLSDVPATTEVTWGVYDLMGGSSFLANFVNEKKDALVIKPPYGDMVFTPDALAGEGVR